MKNDLERYQYQVRTMKRCVAQLDEKIEALGGEGQEYQLEQHILYRESVKQKIEEKKALIAKIEGR